MFVIERVDELGDEAANRMLKTLEEPASFVHLILLTDRLVDVLPTIRSRCQLVRFDAPPVAEVRGRRSRRSVLHLTRRWRARDCRSGTASARVSWQERKGWRCARRPSASRAP